MAASHVAKPGDRSRDGEGGLVAVPQHALPAASEAQQRAVGAEDERVQRPAAHLHCLPSTGDGLRRRDGLAPFAVLAETQVGHEGLALLVQRGAPAGEHLPVADAQGVVATRSTRDPCGCRRCVGLGELVHRAGRREIPHRTPSLDGLRYGLLDLRTSKCGGGRGHY